MFKKWIKLCIYCFLFLLSNLAGNAQTAEIQKLQNTLSKTKDSAVYVDKLNRIGMLMQMKSPDSCFVYGSKAKDISRRINYRKGLADANNVMAISLAVKGMQHEAMKLFKEALSGYQNLDDTSNIVQVYLNMSILFSSLEDRKNMKIYSDRAMSLGKKIPNDSIMSIVYSNYVLANQNISQDSLKYYRAKSNLIAEKFKDAKVLMINRLDEASKFIIVKDKTTALPILTSILSEARKLGIEYAELMALGALSNLYSDEPKLAIAYSEDALAVAQKGGFSYVEPLILQEMLHYAEILKDSNKQIEIAKKLVATSSVQQRQLQLFFGDYMHFNEIQTKNISLEKQSEADNKYIILLYTFLVICILLIIAVILLYKNARKISKRKTAYNLEITEKNKKLQEADDFKNRLVSILAHDFRSPMISTLYLVDILSTDTDLSATEKDELYTTIKDDVNKILKKFDMTLQWITQQLNGYKVQITQLRIAELIDDVMQNFALQTQKKGLTIINTIPSNTTIISDREMLQFINRNLISNAIKYSPNNGRITIDIIQENNYWIVAVSDQGNGLDAKTRETLFSVGNLSGSTNEGAGIALSMCKDFITKLGGEINEKDNADGGATFYYTILVDQSITE